MRLYLTTAILLLVLLVPTTAHAEPECRSAAWIAAAYPDASVSLALGDGGVVEAIEVEDADRMLRFDLSGRPLSTRDL